MNARTWWTARNGMEQETSAYVVRGWRGWGEWARRLNKAFQALLLQMHGIWQGSGLKHKLYFMIIDSEPNVTCVCKHTHTPQAGTHKWVSWTELVDYQAHITLSLFIQVWTPPTKMSLSSDEIEQSWPLGLQNLVKNMCSYNPEFKSKLSSRRNRVNSNKLISLSLFQFLCQSQYNINTSCSFEDYMWYYSWLLRVIPQIESAQ